MGSHRILAIASLAFLLSACDVGTFGDPVDIPVDGDTPTALTYDGQISADVAACASCHGATLQEGGYRTDSYPAIIGVGSDGIANVLPNNAASLFVTEMDPAGPPRTEHTAFATAARLQLYTDWVNAGAPEAE